MKQILIIRFAAVFFSVLLAGVCAVALRADDAAKKKISAQAHLTKARDFAADYKMEKAADEAHKALADDPTLAEAYVIAALPALRAGQLKDAQEQFQKALEIDPYQATAHCYLAYVLYEQGDADSAIDQWTLAIKLDPHSPHSYAGMALAQFHLGQKEQAGKTYTKAVQYDRRFSDEKFLASDSGPKWNAQMLADVHQILPLVQQTTLY
ncbi:MAG: tetratricopeptide repeat protein [Candidatus Acidiferrales bacterium]